MKKTFFSGALLLALVGLFPAVSAAGDQDFSKITCKELVAAPEDHGGLMLMWIDGYISGKSDNTVMNLGWIEKLGKHMADYCTKNPDNTIMQAMEAIQE